jgi:hypothetical protein
MNISTVSHRSKGDVHAQGFKSAHEDFPPSHHFFKPLAGAWQVLLRVFLIGCFSQGGSFIKEGG